MVIAPDAGTTDGPALTVLPLLTARGDQFSRRRDPVLSIAGAPIAETSVAAPLAVARTVLAQHETPVAISRARRRDLLTEASRIYRDDIVLGWSFTEHCAAVAAVSGHSRVVATALCEAAGTAIADATGRAEAGRPRLAHMSARDAADTINRDGGAAVWARRARVLGAVLSGNSPTVNTTWLQALALGYRVAVRPSSREPFTSARIITSLRLAGLAPAAVTYLPTDHSGADEILTRSDLGLLYGGPDIVQQYAHDPTIKVGGPGRSKTVVTHGALEAPRTLHTVAESVTAQSGTACVNTSAVLVEGDHLAFAHALAEVITRDPYGERGPHLPADRVASIRQWLTERAHSGHLAIDLDAVIAQQPDGTATVGPAVIAVDPDDPYVGYEVPFPCVFVAPWDRLAGTAALRDSLVVSVLGDDAAELADRLLDEPSITNVRVNSPTTQTLPLLPHDDHMASFLMTTKSYVTGPV